MIYCLVFYNKTVFFSESIISYYIFAVDTRCFSKVPGFVYYRTLDLCYNFNTEHYIDYTGHFLPTCASYGAELLRIDSQDRQTYVEHILGNYIRSLFYLDYIPVYFHIKGTNKISNTSN